MNEQIKKGTKKNMKRKKVSTAILTGAMAFSGVAASAPFALAPVTAIAVGGNNTHAVLSGHRGLPSSKLLVRLDEMKKGDYFFIRTCNKTLAYKIYNIKVVEPSDISTLKIEKNKDIVSLVTCTPYGLNTHRLVVTGKRVPYEENVYKSIDEGIPSIREILTNALPLIFLVVFVVLTVPDIIRRRKNS